jgi:glycine oxidase
MNGGGDVIVVGGGVIGLTTAWELVRRGHAVDVVERGVPGREASWAGAGMLAPLAEARRTGAFLDLSLASFERHPAFAAALAEASGIQPEYRTAGKLLVACDDAQLQALQEHLGTWAERFGVERLTGEEARRLEPALSPDVRDAFFIARDHQVDNRRLTRALWVAAARAGARVLHGNGAAAVLTEGSRVAGVRLQDGEELRARWVVVAAGAWSGQLDGLPRPVPTHPVRGQIANLFLVPPPLTRSVVTPDCYIVARADGRILIGSTMEHAGFRAHPTAAGIARLLAGALAAVPSLADAPLAGAWAGLRPGTPDELPILGPDPEVEGLVYATGHFRNGILLAPITAEIVADVIAGRTPSQPLAPFRPERFEPPDPVVAPAPQPEA